MISDFTTDELVKELIVRGVMPRCKCRRWQTYFGHYDRDGYTLRCCGCLRSIENCTC